MSLDVYLKSQEKQKRSSSGIFVRENGQTVEISEEEWTRRHPDREPFRVIETETDTLYSSNITHNLARMANEVGIYKHLWRPEEVGMEFASDLIDPLREALHLLKMSPEKYKKFNPENGWGSYDVFVNFVENYLNACYKFRDAEIAVSR